MADGFTYIVVGGGRAGASAIEGIRDLDRKGSIALFGNENRLPYDRPPLSKGLWLGKAKTEDLPIHDDAFYVSHDVQMFLDNAVTEVIPSAHQVLDAQAKRYSYEKLLIATGGSPRMLPFGEGVLHYYRTVEDYHWLKEQTEHADEFIVLGGGFMGSELAAALTLNGKKVTMVFPDRTILHKVLPADLSVFVTQQYRSKGVTVLSGEVPVSASRSETRTIVTTKSGLQLNADAAIAAIGLDLNLGMIKSSGVKVEDGVIVNSLLQTSDPDIYAAGDVASFPATSLATRMRVEHWNNAQVQGRYAGGNMAGANKPYDYLPYFYSDLFELGFEAVGRLDARLTTYADWKDEFRKGIVYYLESERVKGVLLWNVWEKVDEARGIIAAQKQFINIDELRGKL